MCSKIERSQTCYVNVDEIITRMVCPKTKRWKTSSHCSTCSFWNSGCLNSHNPRYPVLKPFRVTWGLISHLQQRHYQPFKSRGSPKSCRALQSYNSPGDWARELSKPSTDLASLVVKIEKKTFFVFGGGFWRWRHKEGMFWKFGPPLPALGPNPLTHSFGSKFCWKLGKIPRL